MDDEQKFCPHCDVTMDLHPDGADDGDEWACDIALRKAGLLESFESIFI